MPPDANEWQISPPQSENSGAMSFAKSRGTLLVHTIGVGTRAPESAQPTVGGRFKLRLPPLAGGGVLGAELQAMSKLKHSEAQRTSVIDVLLTVTRIERSTARHYGTRKHRSKSKRTHT